MHMSKIKAKASAFFISSGLGGGGEGVPPTVLVAVTRAALNTSLGTQDFTSADCGGLTPKAAMFFLTKGVTDGMKADNGAIAIGATDGTRQWSFGMQAEDAAATTATDKFTESDHCIAMIDTAGAIEGSAAFSAWIADGITINIDDAFPAGYQLTVVFYCGADLSAYAGTAALGNTLDLETNITAPNFRPDIVLAAHSGLTSLDAVGTTGSTCFGVAHDTGGIVTQRCLAYRSNNAQATATLGSRLSTLYGVISMAITGEVTWGGEFANFDSQGFSIFTRIAGGASNHVGYLALKFGGVASAWVGTVASPTATGNAAITSPSFKPQFVMQGLSMAPLVDTAYADDNANSFGIGVMTANAQFCNSLWDDDGAADSNSECISDNQPINIQNGVDGTGLAASFVSFDDNGWTVNFSDVEAAAKQSWAVAISNPQ